MPNRLGLGVRPGLWSELWQELSANGFDFGRSKPHMGLWLRLGLELGLGLGLGLGPGLGLGLGPLDVPIRLGSGCALRGLPMGSS